MVIGPTPPGTGVMAPATASASAKSTSPTRREPDLREASAMRLMPTSITQAPALIQSDLTMFGRPTAGTRMSALRHSTGKLSVREWATVTVQFCSRNRRAAGFPTRMDRPMMTQCLPDRSPSVSFARITQPVGVQGRRPGCPSSKRPALVSVRPSTSLSGSISAMTRSESMWPGRGSCTRMPSTSGSAFSARTVSTTVSSDVSAARRRSTLRIPAALVNLILLPT